MSPWKPAPSSALSCCVAVEGGALSGDLGNTATLLLRGVSLVVAVLLVIDLATLVAGISVAAIQVGVMILEHHYHPLSIAGAAMGVALAMLGPGAWSLDACVFGRKRIV